MNIAVRIKDMPESSTGATRVLWLVGDGDIAHCVVTSAVDAYSGPETFVFASDGEGNVTDYMDLPGSFRGDFDHDNAISGYVTWLNGKDTPLVEMSTSELIERVFGGH